MAVQRPLRIQVDHEQFVAEMREFARRFDEACEKAARGIKLAFIKDKDLTPEQRDIKSQLWYERRVREERRLGLEFVKHKAWDVRKELGLDGHRRTD